METPNPLTCIICANGETGDGAMVRRVLAAAPQATVIAADGGARVAQALGLPVHRLVGDLDSVDADEVAALVAQGAQVQRHPPEKDETDLELALKWAVAQGATWIRILGAVGGRLDQTLGNVYLLALPELAGRDTRLVAGRQEAWLLADGTTVVEGAPGDTVSLLPVSGPVRGVRTEQLYYPLRDETLTFGPARGISNVMQADRARVWAREGTLLVIHTLGRA